MEGRRCRNGVERLVPGLGGEGWDELHVPREADCKERAACAQRGERAVVVAAALAEAVAREICCHERDEQHIGSCARLLWVGLGDSAEAWREVGEIGEVEGEWGFGHDARKSDAPAACAGGGLDGGRVDFVTHGRETAEDAWGAEMGQEDGGKRCLEALPDGRCEPCHEGGAGGAGRSA